MKKGLLLMLAATVLLAAMLLPITAAIPADPLLATVRTSIGATVGTDTAGAAVGIYRDGAPLLLEGYGYVKITDEALITPGTVFELGELSALLVALAAYRAEEQGLLSLTATVDTYLPADFYGKLGFPHPVTTEQLLLGCSGLDARTFDLLLEKESHRFSSLQEALLVEVPRQVGIPGEYYSYSPFGIALAAYVLECVTGRGYAELVTTDILTPLGMTATYPDPDDDTAKDHRAQGHIKREAGSFAVGARHGYSYSGLYPAGGALSTPEDLMKLLSFLLKGNEAVLSETARARLLATVFENGIFATSAPAMTVRGSAIGCTGGTVCFGASLFIDPNAGLGAFALTNTADSALLALPATLCGAAVGKPVELAEGYPDLSALEGLYVSSESENRSFVGRMLRKESGERVEINEDGTILFRGMRLRQIAMGVFGDAAVESPVALVQFVLNGEGEVSRIVTADGTTYLPMSFFEGKTPSDVLYYALLILCAGFLLAGIFSLILYLLRRDDREGGSFIFMLALLFAALMSIFVLLQIFVGIEYGAAAFSSFFSAMSFITMLCSIGAAGCLLVSFVVSILHRGMPAKVASAVTFFLGLVALVHVFGLSVL